MTKVTDDKDAGQTPPTPPHGHTPEEVAYLARMGLRPGDVLCIDYEDAGEGDDPPYREIRRFIIRADPDEPS